MWALLPLKQFAYAKQRLSSVLSGEERYRLFTAMVKDVLTVLQQHPDIQGTLIISDDPTVESLAAEYHAEWLTEAGLQVRGLNAAVQAGVDVLARRGIDDVMVVHGDLPLLTIEEITCLVEAHRQQVSATAAEVPRPLLTVIPDERRVGTNCLLCSPASRMTYCFGTDSFLAHVAQASRCGLSLQVLGLPGLMCDIDTPVDLISLVQRANADTAKHSFDFIQASGLPARLARSQSREPAGLHFHQVS